MKCDNSCDAEIFQATEANEPARLTYKFSNTHASSVRTIMIARRTIHDRSTDPLRPISKNIPATAENHPHLACGDAGHEQLLIFTKGSQTYTPHQIGIKRMPCTVNDLLYEQQGHDTDLETHDYGQNADDADDDDVNWTIELHGHIIGMNLSPDHRYKFTLKCGVRRVRIWPEVSLSVKLILLYKISVIS